MSEDTDYKERIARVEARVELVVVKHDYLSTVVEKQQTLLEKVVAQITSNEQAAVAIRERTDHHTKTIEHLQESDVDTHKILVGLTTSLNVVKYVGGGAFTVLLGVLVSHYIK